MKRWIAWGSAILFTFGIALITTHLCAKHFTASRKSAPIGIFAAHEWAHSIGLTKDQQKQLEPMEASLKKDIDSMQVKLAQERIALCSLMQNASGDSAELNAYIKRIGALEAEQQRRVVQHLMVMRDILTPVQRDQFFAAIMQQICAGCRTAVPGQKCLCGMHTSMK